MMRMRLLTARTTGTARQVLFAIEAFRLTASDITEDLFEQERNLTALKGDITDFLTDLRKTG